MTSAKLDPIAQTNLRESAYQALHAAFTRGAFAPGDTLSLRTLAAELGISMTPVREAVRRLVAEGALIDTRSRKLLVPPFDARRMADLKSARLALETLVLDQVMEQIDADGIAALRAVLARPADQGAPDLTRNYDFHFTLYRLSGSEVLLPMIEGLWLQYGAYLNLVIREDAAREVAEDEHHLAIIDGLERRDRQATLDALTADIERSFALLQARQTEHPA
ncbi:GntR family transcriptional regulator [Sagittula sp. SSi028]|uniref:GntR family transcriptional regulator n=1 Tax=Sagittula sp. SSi028 TaxID=3400636 RepID=UPI003AF50FC1